jgi:hypothetical protein
MAEYEAEKQKLRTKARKRKQFQIWWIEAIITDCQQSECMN